MTAVDDRQHEAVLGSRDIGVALEREGRLGGFDRTVPADAGAGPRLQRYLGSGVASAIRMMDVVP